MSLLDKLDDIVSISRLQRNLRAGTKSNRRRVLYYASRSNGRHRRGCRTSLSAFFTVPKVRDARRSAGFALLFIAILYTTAPAVGAMARYNLINTVQPGPVGAPDGNLEYVERPGWFDTWEATGLVSVDDQERGRPYPVLQRHEPGVCGGCGGLRLGGKRANG